MPRSAPPTSCPDPPPPDVLPTNPLFDGDSKLTVQEAAYAYSGWIFAQHFLNRLGPSFAALSDILDEQDTAQAAVLSDIRARFRQETYTRASILEALQRYPEIVRFLSAMWGSDGMLTLSVRDARSDCCTSRSR